jgi:hypothetical protein
MLILHVFLLYPRRDEHKKELRHNTAARTAKKSG